MACEDNPEPNTRMPDEWYSVTLRALQPSTRHRLCLHLNIPAEISFNDWRRLAEMVNIENLVIENLKRSSNPTEMVIIKAINMEYTVGMFMEILRDMERLDIFGDCRERIETDVKQYRPVQIANEAGSTSEAPLTLGELRTAKVEYFDAFLSYHPEDYEFVMELLKTVEDEWGFKICVPERNFCVGLVENDATAKLIKRRCKRTIIILSRNYVSLPDLEAKLKWQLQMAQSLAPVAETMHKLVPIVIDKGVEKPDILTPYNMCDYTQGNRQWFWMRLEGALAARTNNDGGYEGPDRRLGEKVDKKMRANTAPANLSNGDRTNDFPQSNSSSSLTDSPGRSRFYRPTPKTRDSPKQTKKWWPR